MHRLMLLAVALFLALFAPIPSAQAAPLADTITIDGMLNYGYCEGNNTSARYDTLRPNWEDTLLVTLGGVLQDEFKFWSDKPNAIFYGTGWLTTSEVDASSVTGSSIEFNNVLDEGYATVFGCRVPPPTPTPSPTTVPTATPQPNQCVVYNKPGGNGAWTVNLAPSMAGWTVTTSGSFYYAYLDGGQSESGPVAAVTNYLIVDYALVGSNGFGSYNGRFAMAAGLWSFRSPATVTLCPPPAVPPEYPDWACTSTPIGVTPSWSDMLELKHGYQVTISTGSHYLRYWNDYPHTYMDFGPFAAPVYTVVAGLVAPMQGSNLRAGYWQFRSGVAGTVLACPFDATPTPTATGTAATSTPTATRTATATSTATATATSSPSPTVTSTPVAARPAMPCPVARHDNVPVAPGSVLLSLVEGEAVGVAGASVWFNLGGQSLEVPEGVYTWSVPSGAYIAFSLTVPATVWRCVVFPTATSTATGTATVGTVVATPGGLAPTWSPIDGVGPLVATICTKDPCHTVVEVGEMAQTAVGVIVDGSPVEMPQGCTIAFPDAPAGAPVASGPLAGAAPSLADIGAGLCQVIEVTPYWRYLTWLGSSLLIGWWFYMYFRGLMRRLGD